ncbi:hypothetical protein ACFLTE_08150 [Bacteroidota bacterium]
MDKFYFVLGNEKAQAFKNMINSFDEFLKLNFKNEVTQGQRIMKFIYVLNMNGCKLDTSWIFNLQKDKEAQERFEKSGMRKEIWIKINENYSDFSDQEKDLLLTVYTADFKEKVIPLVKSDSGIILDNNSRKTYEDYFHFNSKGLFLKGLAAIQDQDTLIRDYVEAKNIAGDTSVLLLLGGLNQFDEKTLEKPYIKMIIVAEIYINLLEKYIKK